jgi:ADP-heptose:LPS heptosyltransferase
MSEVERPGRQCFALAGEVSLAEFCYVLQHARLTITVDTSPLHLSSALGTPVVGIRRRYRASGVRSPQTR